MCRSVLTFAFCMGHYFVYEVDTMKIQSSAGNNNDKIVVAVIIIIIIIIIIRGLIQGINPGWVIGRNFLLLN